MSYASFSAVMIAFTPDEVLQIVPNAGSDRRRERRRVARRERIGRRVVDQILAAPSGAFEYGGVPAPCVGQIAFARHRPPREASANAGEQRSAHTSLSHPLQGERGA